MAKVKELQARIKSVKDIQKLTNAMYMIASNRRKKAMDYWERNEYYFEAIQTELRRIFKSMDQLESPYFFHSEEEENPRLGLLLLSGDRGLAGAFNHNIIKRAEEFFQEQESEPALYLLGNYAYKHYLAEGRAITEHFAIDSLHLQFDHARDIAQRLISDFDAGKITQIYILYTKLDGPFKETVVVERLLPLYKFKDIAEEPSLRTDFDFYPSAEALLDSLLSSYLTGYIYGAIIDSFSSEENSRLRAMQEANENARDLIAELSLARNLARQNAITSAISEVSAGAKAQSQDRAKR